ncbi:MAG: AAA family ATPase [Methanoregula sp.]|uniref:AAA family ATPase n=1 Tax=Methanoregula sp. TaxID=2052170 RepID=UPI0025F21590|nr:AAA family ATPase [Methanoregula sp.]MCK9630510.1 AAA family ATPase [Methanoregula sp.]
MPIQQIHVENFKSFSELDVNLARFNVVIGSNAAGKSNFISIFRFLRDIASYGVVNAIAMQGGAEYLVNAQIGTTRDLVIRVSYIPDTAMDVVETSPGAPSLLGMKACESSYEFALRFSGQADEFTITRDRLRIGCEVSSCRREGASVVEDNPIGRGEIEVSNENGAVHYAVQVPEGCPLTQDEIIPIFFRNTHLPGKTLILETVFGFPLPHLDRFFDRIAVYDIDPKLPKKGAVITGKRELESDGGNLALVLKKIIDDPEKKRKFSNLLRDTLPFVEEFSVQKFMDVSLILTLRERYAKSRDLPASSLSDGTIIIFALIIALYFEDKPFIIIEEPVGHIHPFLVARIMGMMKEASAKKQIMVTTHSAEVVKHASLDDILLISRDSGGYSVVSRPADKEEVRTFLENEIGIEELYLQNLLGM